MYILRDKVHKAYLTHNIARYTRNPLDAALFADYDKALAKLNEVKEAMEWGKKNMPEVPWTFVIDSVEYKCSELEICEFTFNITPVK